ncbi:hypothetical protein JL721_8942 [Aureococcus anophagefferens]|nr:hypothetical protein JL721_8942 [Aureococcus anophagefferens]
MAAMKPRVTLLDYGAGNVRSVVNALELLGCDVSLVRTAADVLGAEILVFPGVGCFGAAMDALEALDLLFGRFEETPGARGLGVVDGDVTLFEPSDGAVVPSMGWNEALGLDPGAGLFEPRERYYFVHSYKVSRCDPAWRATVTDYGGVRYTSALANGRRVACQFHPGKSGPKGLALLDRFVTRSRGATALPSLGAPLPSSTTTLMAPRVISALDVRSNDDGDLVVTKGDGYDVREKAEGGAVRNLGKPVDLCARYYDEGADEICVLNICAFKGEAAGDLPLLGVLRAASERCFVPLTIGGGVRDYTARDGSAVSALDVASAYFRAGATRRGGEFMVNCIDCDGKGDGYDLELLKIVKRSVAVPVIASSGAGEPAHFAEAFELARADAALAAGIFHRREVAIAAVKAHLKGRGISCATKRWGGFAVAIAAVKAHLKGRGILVRD